MGFEHLSTYFYIMGGWDKNGKPLPPPKNQIPRDVLAYNGREVAIKGYAMPLEFGDNGITAFVLMRHLSTCCFGAGLQPTDFIVVHFVPGKAAKSMPFKPITVFGRLEVGEKFKDGFLMSLYRMTAEKVETD